MSGQKLSRYYRTPPFVVSKTVTFTGEAGAGEVDSPIPVFDVSGDVAFQVAVKVTQPLVCANIANTFLGFGSTGFTPDSDELIGSYGGDVTGATGWWDGDAISAGNVGFTSEGATNVDLILTVTDYDEGSAADITAGEMTFYAIYRPLSPGASVQPA